MANEQENPVPQNDETASHHDPVTWARVLLGRHLRTVLIAVIAAVAAILGSSLLASRRQAARERAFQMLALAASPRQFEEIVQQYPKSPASQIALLALAQAQFNAGSYDQASRTYESFEEKHADHFMVPAARLGRIHCLEALGLTEDALDGFRAFASSHPSSYLLPVARLGEARCLRQLGRLEEARQTYEDVIATFPASEWIPYAEDLLEQVRKELQKPAA